MFKNYSAINKDVIDGAGALKYATPNVMREFADFGTTAYADDNRARKQKELMAVATPLRACDVFKSASE